MRSLATRSTIVVVGLAALPVLAACSSNASSTSSSSPATSSASASTSGGAINVTSTDTTCDVSTNTAKAGSTTFAVTNSGSQTTEVYVYGKEGETFSKVIAEVEHVGPGTARDFTADLTAGTYEIACKPGETGDGIRSTLTVTS